MKKLLFSTIILLCFLLSPISSISQTADKSNPKLVIGIVVDQMRYDYLTRFYNKYGEGGFKRLMNEGFNCKNNHFNYVPTYTGPGHASVYTGTTPKYHGIISNNWYDKESKETVYCAGDESVNSVGTLKADGKMSPHRMQTTTFADENRLYTQKQGKTIGVSIKDRGAILPAGHTANAAYWFRGKSEGKFISSTYYMTELPKWVSDFNASGKVASYLKPWNTLYDIATYTESGKDLNTFEGVFNGKETATFPYDLKKLSKINGGYDILKSTAYGNSIVTDFAIAAVEGEQLGTDAITDVLAVSYSSTDYIGHKFGVNSKEVQDTYLRLDLELEKLLNFLDDKIGEMEYTVFLTADHGAVDVPAYLKSLNVPAGYVDNSDMKTKFTEFMTKTYGTSDLVENVSNNQVFLNREKIKALGLDLSAVQQTIVNELITYNDIDKAYTAHAMISTSFPDGIEHMIQNGFNQKRSGDVIVVYNPAYISYSHTGSTHGSGFNYDTHVPLLFYGKGVKQGSTVTRTVIPDIAPTMSALLNISFPSGATGSPLEFVIKK
ncbi:alkaline phosphatase PafA [Corallibacter sp.]|uniref:alkaline phosphatase PafA n=1 Tax=Corallibacter sp. TaxID=2038084 RepID=UPI003AB71E5D